MNLGDVQIPFVPADIERINFYTSSYDVIFKAGMGLSSPKIVLGAERVCRFCGRCRPEVSFRSIAHAIPELLGNKRVYSKYECATCNTLFSRLEDDLAKYAALFLLSSQTKGKAGIPKLKTRRKLSSAEVKEDGFLFTQHTDDPIVSLNAAAGTFHLKIVHQKYRPLGVFKALVKTALTLMPEAELGAFEDTLRWLREPVERGPIARPALLVRSFIPGPRPIPEPRVVLFRRKEGQDVPFSTLLILTGNIGFQILVPCPSRDGEGHIPPAPVTTFADPELIKGPPQYFFENLTSGELADAPSEATFNVDEVHEGPAEGRSTAPESGG